MLTITFRLAKKHEACKKSYQRFARHVDGVKKFGEDTPIPLAEIADVCGFEDASWCLRYLVNQKLAKEQSRFLAADYAEHVLPIYENQYPADDRPRKAIEAARLYTEGKIRKDTCDAAGAAARAAAYAAAYVAARAAAYAAACVAARTAAYAAADAAACDAAYVAACDAAYVAACDAACDAAGDAAYAAADAAAGAAAGAAAYAAAYVAAWDAEREWQLKHFKEVVSL